MKKNEYTSKSNRYFSYNPVSQMQPRDLDGIERGMKFIVSKQP